MPRQMLVGLLAACCLVGLAVGGVAATDLSADRSLETAEADPGETVTVTTTVELDSDSEIDYIEEFNPVFEDVSIESMTNNGESFVPLLSDTSEESVLVFTNEVDAGTVTIVFEVTLPDDASPGSSFSFDGEVSAGGDDNPTIVDGDQTLTVAGEPPEEADETDDAPADDSGTAADDADGATDDGDTPADDQSDDTETEDTLAVPILVPATAVFLTVVLLIRRASQ